MAEKTVEVKMKTGLQARQAALLYKKQIDLQRIYF